MVGKFGQARIGRRVVFLLVVAALLLVPMAAIAAGGFDDVSDDNIYVSDISWISDAGVTKGCNPPLNTEFCPEDAVTREQMAAFLHRLAMNRVVDAGTVEGFTADELKGQTGPVGPAGVDGADGADGAQGEPGVAGADGADGVDGVDGVDGAMGPQGDPGVDGVDGVDGAMGPMGPMGPEGIQGAVGPAGAPGSDGVDGAMGPIGPVGPAGADGADGFGSISFYTVAENQPYDESTFIGGTVNTSPSCAAGDQPISGSFKIPGGGWVTNSSLQGSQWVFSAQVYGAGVFESMVVCAHIVAATP